MVMPFHETDTPEWPMWRWWLILIAGASIVCAGVWWFASRDKMETLFAAALPWTIAVVCLAISLIWAVTTVPLMILIGKCCGRRKSGGRPDD